MRQRSPDNQATQRMPYEAHPSQAGHRAKRLNILLNFISQALAHLEDVALGLLFVGAGGQEDGVGVHQAQVVLQETHVAGVALETVHQHE